jgi:hypothetical protein
MTIGVIPMIAVERLPAWCGYTVNGGVRFAGGSPESPDFPFVFFSHTERECDFIFGILRFFVL